MTYKRVEVTLADGRVVSAQRAWAIMKPERARIVRRRYELTEKRRAGKREWARKQRQNATD